MQAVNFVTMLRARVIRAGAAAPRAGTHQVLFVADRGSPSIDTRACMRVSASFGLKHPLVADQLCRFDNNRSPIPNRIGTVSCRLCPAWLSLSALFRSPSLQAINYQCLNIHCCLLCCYVCCCMYICTNLPNHTIFDDRRYPCTIHALCSDLLIFPLPISFSFSTFLLYILFFSSIALLVSPLLLFSSLLFSSPLFPSRSSIIV